MNLSHIVAVTNRHLVPVATATQIQALTTELSYPPVNAHIPLLAQINLLAEADTEFIILREKDMDEADYLALSQAAIEICNNRHKKLVLHTYMNTAIKLGHPHIHLSYSALLNYVSAQNGCVHTASHTVVKHPQSTDIEQHTGLSFELLTLGVSIHSSEEAIQAEQLGATYLTAGHIFATDCKKGLPPRGLDWLKDITASVSIPVYAIGGITKDNLSSVMQYGAAGGCMMSGAMHYPE